MLRALATASAALLGVACECSYQWVDDGTTSDLRWFVDGIEQEVFEPSFAATITQLESQTPGGVVTRHLNLYAGARSVGSSTEGLSFMIDDIPVVEGEIVVDARTPGGIGSWGVSSSASPMVGSVLVTDLNGVECKTDTESYDDNGTTCAGNLSGELDLTSTDARYRVFGTFNQKSHIDGCH